MPWKKSDGTYIKEGKAWVGVDGTKYPSVWRRFSDDELKTFGLTWENPPASQEPFDNRFYLGRKTDGSLIEKDLTDINVVDEDGKAVIDIITGKQVIQLGLKTVWITKTKQTANDLLSNTDWMITRKSEKGTAIPDATTKYRDSVRTACNTIETKINACSNLTEFMALFDVPVDSDKNPTGNAPINDFPTEN
jgi:hypothetical protein